MPDLGNYSSELLFSIPFAQSDIFTISITDSGISISETNITRKLTTNRTILESAKSVIDSGITRKLFAKRNLTESGISINQVLVVKIIHFGFVTILEAGINITESLSRIQFLHRTISEGNKTITDGISAIRQKMIAIFETGKSIIDSGIIRKKFAVRYIPDPFIIMPPEQRHSDNVVVIDNGIIGRSIRKPTIHESGIAIMDTLLRISFQKRTITEIGIIITDFLSTGVSIIRSCRAYFTKRTAVIDESG